MRVSSLQPSEDLFDTLANQMSRMMDELSRRQFYDFSTGDAWEPAMNMYATAAAYYVCVDLAGMNHETIDVRDDGGRLVIRGRRETPQPPDAQPPLSVDLMEIDSGPFSRSLAMPHDVDRTRIRARYREGLLWITLPRGQSESEETTS